MSRSQRPEGVIAALRRPVGLGWFVLLMVVLLAACDAKPPDRRPEVDRLTQEIRGMPGVQGASDDVADSPAQDLVYFHIRVDMADDITSDQLAAITSLYLHALPAVEDGGYRAELSARAGWNVFRINSGKRPVTNSAQIIAQAQAWVAIRHEFPGATIRLRATITHPTGQLAIQEWGHSNVGAIELPDPADYTAVTLAVTTLTTRFPQLSSLDWTISAGKQHPADSRHLAAFPVLKNSRCGTGSTPTSPSPTSTR